MFEVDADAPVVTADIEKTTTAITVEPVIETENEGQSQKDSDSQLETAPPVSDTVDVQGDKPVAEEQQGEVTVQQQIGSEIEVAENPAIFLDGQDNFANDMQQENDAQADKSNDLEAETVEVLTSSQQTIETSHEIPIEVNVEVKSPKSPRPKKNQVVPEGVASPREQKAKKNQVVPFDMITEGRC